MSLLAAAVLATGIPGTQGRWWYLFADADQVWLADTISYLSDDGMVDMWYQVVLRKPEDHVSYRLVRWRVDCKIRVSATISSDSYTERGDSVTKYALPPRAREMQAIPPESNGETLALFACSHPEHWSILGFRAVFRNPVRVARDFYQLIYMGLNDDQAIALARYAADTQMEQIEATIDEIVPPALRPKVRVAYGLPGKGIF